MHGICFMNAGNINKCYNTGTISGNSNVYAGIVCRNQNMGEITNCYNIGDVIAVVNRQSGGITYDNKGMIANCYNIGEITISGICYNNSGKILNSYYLDESAKNLYNSDSGTIEQECASKPKKK